MPIAQWDPKYVTGHKPVDEQHKMLFGMVNNLHDAIISGKGPEVLGPTLQELARYTIEHFAEEEKLMASINYVNSAEHKSKHDALTTQVKDLLDRYATGKLALSMTLSTFLANWLQHHIKEDDILLIQHMQARAREQLAAQ
jgi:hemerythrin-like metal-binding protein